MSTGAVSAWQREISAAQLAIPSMSRLASQEARLLRGGELDHRFDRNAVGLSSGPTWGHADPGVTPQGAAESSSCPDAS